MNNSIFLARVIGLCLFILSLALLINEKSLMPAIISIFQNGALQFIVGMILLVVGALLVVTHNVWKKSWILVITILSWLILIKGILYLIFPEFVQIISHQFSYSNRGIYIGGTINLLVSIYLCYMGFFTDSKG